MKPRIPSLLTGGATLALTMLAGTPALAQIDTGSIVGTVSDASGAVLPAATVTATQEGTGASVSAVTNARGQYFLPNLKIGRYTVGVEAKGFKRGVHRSLQLHVQQRLEVNFSLELGAIAEEVVVSGQAELLQTQTGDMGHAVDQRQLVDLPLLGRRYAELALLQTGVVPAGQGIAGRGDDTFFNSNGNFATWNNFTLDGGDNNSFSTNLQERSLQVIQPPVDALEEFRIQTRTYSAEFGRSAGAVVNASIKQGGNRYRGTAFGFLRDEAFNANVWENERAGRPKGKFDQYIAGATLGGPLVKNRLFFFGDYQATRTERAVADLATVPTPLMRQGNLSELPRTLGGTNPFVPAGCVLPGNVVDPACLDPVSRQLINLYPQPNLQSAIDAFGRPGGFVSPNYINNGVLENDVDQFDARLDLKLREGKDSLFVRYSQMETDRNEPPVLGPIASGDFNSHHSIKGQSAVLGWTHILSSSMLAEVRGAWNRIDGDSFHPAFGIDSNQEFGIRGIPQDPRYSGGLPHMNVAGLTRLGGPFFRPQFQTSQVYQLSASLTWNKGAHSMKLGIERRRDKVDYIDLRALNGFLTFSDGRYTNSGIGDFLLGLATQQGLTLFHEARLFTDGWQVFAQDSWRPTEDLTVNYGLRYEFFTPLQDQENILTNIDPATGERIQARDSGSLFERTLIRPDRNNFAPRVSVAWTASPRLVLRGGYGTYYQHTDRYGSESQLALNPPQLIDVFVSAPSANAAPVLRLRDGFVPPTLANVNIAAVQWRIQDPDQRTPIIHQFSVGPEYLLSASMTASVEYVGNLIRNGRRLRNLNQGMFTPTGVVFPYARFGYGTAFLEQIVTNGRANYHALQTKLQRRLRGGLGFTASYTWSKSLADFLDHLSADRGATGNFPQNAYDMAADYGPTEFDIPHRFVLSFIYEFPAGRGRKGRLGGAPGALLNDWSLNGILALNAGRPFTITSTDRTGVGGSGRISRADCLGDAQPPGFDKSVDAWFDTTKFAEPAAGRFGTCGSNTVRAAGQKFLNLSLFRSFPLGGDRRLEFRLEGFNVFNWVNYGFPGRSVSSRETFGRISSSLGDPREMQFAIKLYF